MAKSSFKSAKEQDAQIASLKVPPHSVEAEQSVLGGLMLDNNAWDRVAEKVVKGDFYLRQHKQIFAAMASLMIKNHPIDLITVSEALEKDKIKGIKIVRQAKAQWIEEFDKRVNPLGKEYYWLSGEFVNQDDGKDTDEWALANGYVSVVPVQFDLTAHTAIDQLKKWNL